MDVEEMCNEEIQPTLAGKEPTTESEEPSCSSNESLMEEHMSGVDIIPTPQPGLEETSQNKGKEMRKPSTHTKKSAEVGKKEGRHCKRAKVNISDNSIEELEATKIPMDSTEPQLRLEPKEPRLKPKFKDRETTSPAASELDTKE